MTAEEESRWNEFLLDPSPKISDAVKNYFQLQLAKGLSDATNLHIVSRELLKAINSASLLTYGEYEERYPQGEKTAAERIAEVGKYNSARQVLEVIRRREGKPSKLLGRNYLLIIFDDVKNKLLADEIVVEPKGLTKAYLDGFEHELRNPDSFVWAADMVTAIHKDNEKRRQEAQERAEEYAEGGDGEAAIRQAMHEALDR